MAKIIAICNQKGGVSKCVKEGTKILLADGTIEYIHNLFDKHLQNAANVESNARETYITPNQIIEILALDQHLKLKPAAITKLYRGSSDTLYSILTERGNHIAVTPEHPLMQLFGGRVTWTKASGLRRGDFIATARTLPIRHNSTPALNLLSDQISVIAHRHIRDIIKSNLEEILRVSKYGRDKYERDCLLLDDEALIEEFLNKGINSIAFKYLLKKGLVSYEDIVGVLYRNRFGKNCDIFYWNTIIDKEMAMCIAIIIAEGGIGLSRVVIQNKSQKVINLISHFCERFRLPWKKGVTKKGLQYITILRAGTLVKVLEDVFEIPRIYGGKANRVKAPNIILRSGREILAAYLSAYLDCEGYIAKRKTNVAITSASEENILRLQYAFLQFGITSSVVISASKATNSSRPKKRTYFTLCIRGAENIKKIYMHCCPQLKYKKDALERHFKIKANTNIDIVPVNKVLREARTRNFLFQDEIGNKGNISDYECYESAPSRTALAELATVLEGKVEEEESQYLKNLSESDIFWDRIKSIRRYKYKGYVYDLTVAGFHNFVCGDGAFISHNTTTAINLSSYLALENKKTLLVDLDPQSNATGGVGINKHSVKLSTYNVLHEHTSLEDIIISTQIENFNLAPSNLDLTGAEVELVSAMNREYKLRRAIEKIKNQYDFILVDCPPSLGILTINALTAADSVIIPVQCEYYALEGLSQLMNTINLIKNNLNGQLRIEGVLLTMADYRTNLTKEVIEEVKKFFGDKVYKTIIPRSVKLTEAPGFGKPIVLYDKNSVGAKAYHNMAKEVLGEEMQWSLRGAESAEAISELEGQNGKAIG